MRITHLAYRNFKGHSADIELAPVTLVTGANFNHKTAIPMAVRLALTGYLPPPLGVRGIYALAGNPTQAGTMGINLVLENGRKIVWQWKRDAAGKVSVVGNASPDIAMPQLLMEPKLFFAKTGAEQIQTVFQACDIKPETFSPSIIKNRLSEVQASPLTECERILGIVNEWMDNNKVVTVPSWIALLLDGLKVRQKTASDEAKVAQGAFAAFRGDGAPIFQKDVSQELAAARTQLTGLEVELGGPIEGLQGQRDMLANRLKSFQTAEQYAVDLQKARDILGESSQSNDDYAEAMDKIDELVAALDGTNDRLKEIFTTAEDLQGRIAELEKSDCCPTCGAKRANWKKPTMDKLLAKAASLVQERELLEESYRVKDLELKKLQAWSKAFTDVIRLSGLINQLNGLLQLIAQVDEKLAARDKVAGANSIKIAALKTTIAELEAKQTSFELWQKDRGRKESLEQQMLLAQCRAETYKAVIKIVQEEQEKLVNKAFGTVLKTARHFTDALLNSPLEFVDGGLGRRVSNQDVQMGCQAPIGSWISFDAFSGTEELLALAGFGVALSHEAPTKLVILDELGRLDGKRKLDVALRMLSLVESKIIDQSILVDVDPKAYSALSTRQGFRIVSL